MKDESNYRNKPERLIKVFLKNVSDWQQQRSGELNHCQCKGVNKESAAEKQGETRQRRLTSFS